MQMIHYALYYKIRSHVELLVKKLESWQAIDRYFNKCALAAKLVANSLSPHITKSVISYK